VSPTNRYDQPIGDAVDWEPRPAPVPVVLTGRYVTVRGLEHDHVEALYDALCGPDDDALWTYRPVDRPSTRAAMETFVAGLLAHPSEVSFAICPEGRGPEGIATLMRVDPANGVVEIGGILLARSMQRTPASTEAMYLLAHHVFDALGYRRYEWKCDSLNEPSRAAAFRLGFGYEGRFRNALVYKGRNRDTDWFSITDAEWPRIRAAHEVWLDPANFDESGRQRQRLGDLLDGPGRVPRDAAQRVLRHTT
jgi:RimJ/RimL family protein N-acetyltransferase